MEYLAVDALIPEFNIWQQFISDNVLSALNLDSLHNSHPVEVPVNHPDEIEEIFDLISYQKVNYYLVNINATSFHKANLLSCFKFRELR